MACIEGPCSHGGLALHLDSIITNSLHVVLVNIIANKYKQSLIYSIERAAVETADCKHCSGTVTFNVAALTVPICFHH